MREWPEGRDRDPDVCIPKMVQGDIVVTRVARHYSLGRVGADRRTQTPIEVQERRADALNRACALAGSDHQVFFYENPGTSTCIQINCRQVQDDLTRSALLLGGRRSARRGR
jgi:hypothetical protein